MTWPGARSFTALQTVIIRLCEFDMTNAEINDVAIKSAPRINRGLKLNRVFGGIFMGYE